MKNCLRLIQTKSKFDFNCIYVKVRGECVENESDIFFLLKYNLYEAVSKVIK